MSSAPVFARNAGNAEQDNARMRRIFELAKSELNGEPPRRNPASFEQLQIRMEAKAFQPSTRRPFMLGFALAAAAVVAVLVWQGGLNRQSLEFQVVNGNANASGFVAGSTSGTKIQFTDGTELALHANARTRIFDVSPEGAKVALDRGAMHVRVAPKPKADWQIQAGPYRVQVTGTAFNVDFDASDRALTIDLFTGSVLVTGPLVDNGLSLKAGQQLVVRPEQDLVQVRRRDPLARSEQEGEEPKVAEAVEPEVAQLEPTLKGESRNAAARGAPAREEAQSWAQLVAAGRHSEVVSLAQARGLSQVYQSGTLEEVQALSDAARYARRADIARQALLSLRQRFAGSARGRDAAFFLGRLAEGEGSQSAALKWYDRYLMDNPNGVYASQALGRKLLIVHRSQGRAAAKPLVRDYLERFPKGAYAPAARKLSRGE